MRYSLTAIYILPLLVISGCATWQENYSSKIQNSFYEQNKPRIEQASKDYHDGNFVEARETWKELESVINVLPENKKFPTATYLDAAAFITNMAFAALKAEDYEQARNYFRQAFVYLNQSNEEHKSFNQKRSQTVSDNKFIFESVRLSTYAYMANVANQAASEYAYLYDDMFQNQFETYSKIDFSIKDDASDWSLPSEPGDVKDDGVRAVLQPSIGVSTNIGLLLSSSGMCTATLVGVRLALTAAHCVSGNGKVMKPSDFELVMNDLYIPDKVLIDEVIVNQGKSFDPESLHIDLKDEDWALLVLKRHPVGRGYSGIKLQSDISTGAAVSAFGFSSDLNDGKYLSMHWGCSLNRQSTHFSEYGCRISPGASGGPVFSDNGKYIVGVNSYGPPKDSENFLKYMGAANSSDFINLIAQKRRLFLDNQSDSTPDNSSLEGVKEGFYDWNSDCQFSGVWAASDNGVLFINRKGNQYYGYEERVIPHSGFVSMNKYVGTQGRKQLMMERTSLDEVDIDYGTSELIIDQAYLKNILSYGNPLHSVMAKMDGDGDKYYRKIAPGSCH